ncbi:alpha-ketoglutarate-dependent dioxygenase alkB-like protein 6 [Chlorella sorokiniana]|uniref:Alpha-ketoglutarate-dependent dioxygenase alkB-like protein 6 n=1 Tax=Chlorella sorokiniana TaxID=3076 RepID=A0A2P6TGX8_CHLSO|nr:alpha-ketoglutarate-dependent dioxygenase alkB-like protein 6 [Chlorella sorokiniana]|eukprot:PRW33548.1 alpha-ketoglutarate-dependent dioxygenase alkB-like protein 6 [Chlorella sorokiniana]
MLDLEQFRVGDLPTLYYVPDAITPAEEQSLLTHITASKQQWKTVSGRRLQNLGGIVHKKGLLPAPLPSWLQPLLGKLAADTGAYGEGQAPNHVLINAYQPGEGIMPHEDGPLYHPVVVILSLQNPAVVRFARKRQEGQQGDAAAAAEGTESHARAGQLVASVACMPRSLLIFKDEAYSGCLHGILEAAVEDIDASVVNAQQAGLQIGQALPRGGERISLTVRRVLHTYSLGLRL